MSKKGGYVIVDLKGQSITAGTPFTLDGVTTRLDRAKNKACLLSGFAIGNDEKRDVFVDMQKTEDGYIALFGQYTITIEDDEVTITNGGVLLDNIVDSQGHKRFIEGNGTPGTLAGYTSTYHKWSLSGTHLMFVVAGKFANETVVASNTRLCVFNLPTWIMNKIIPVWSNYIEYKTYSTLAEDWSRQNGNCVLVKTGATEMVIATSGSFTLTLDRSFRIQFDLLIDTAEQEEMNNGN